MRIWLVCLAVALACATPLDARAEATAPTALVNTFVGTSGTETGGPIDTFPGADVPFGMVQWSPDTPSQNAGGGYEYRDRTINGFSLTHLSGPGCNVFGDFGILPTIGALPSDPGSAEQPFSHATESSAPGWYSVSVGTQPINVELTVTQRTGLGRFTFGRTAQANLLFNPSSNQAGVTASSIAIDAPNEISGSASSGFFCGMPDQYTVYFVAQFDRPFAQYGTWNGTQTSLGARSATGPGTGLWLTFDATRNPAVEVKIGLSFVNVAGARANLNAEDRGWDVIAVRNRATDAWSGLLNRIAISGGTPQERRMFYTAFYHTLLHPNVISDVTGLYTGFDGRVHHAKAGHNEYANYSDWDIYRTEVPLLALVVPDAASDMMQSLVDAYKQEGWLPRWALVNGPTSVMGGDSVDPVIAGAYAFGAHDFDVRSALAAMVKGASTTDAPPGQGWYVERWELNDDYLRRGYIVNTHTTSVAPVPNGASETLEYALDDFSIARFARDIHDTPVYDAFMRRAANWEQLFNTATGSIAPRDPDGAFMASPLTENGQSGFQEGNAAQYTWMVPQDLRDLIAGMGGNAATVAKLDTFFTQINSDQNKPYAWLGNEPSLGSPWVYLSVGEPWRTQEIVRRAITTLYDDTPQGLPGNDDLGTMSAWYIWCAMGLYPQNPAVRVLDVGSPLFESISVHGGGSGPAIEIDAPQARDDAPYVARLRINGRMTQDTWLALPAHGSVRLDFELATTPDKTWGSGARNAPPSYAIGPASFPAVTGATLDVPPATLELAPNASAPIELSVANRAGSQASVQWHLVTPSGVQADPDRGTVTIAAGATENFATHISAANGTTPGYYDLHFEGVATNGAALESATVFVQVTQGGAPPALVYVENRFGNTITPVDLITGGTAPEIAVGEQPRDAVLSADGTRLYVANLGGNSVSVVDTRAGRAIANVKVGSSPAGITLAPDGRTLWLVNGDDGTIQSIDSVTLRAGGTIRVGARPRAIAISPDGSTLYVTNGGSNSVTPVDLRTRTAQTPIAVGARPAGIAITPDGSRLYVVNSASNSVTPIDLTGRRVLPAIGVGVYPMLVAIAPNGRLAYVTNDGNSTITPIDLSTDRAGTPIVVGGAPYGVAFTAGGRTAIVVIRRDNACVFVDVATGKVRAPTLLGNGPYTVAAP